MENIDAPKLLKSLLQRYTEQIKPPSVSGNNIFYGLACKCYFYSCFSKTLLFVYFLSKFMEHTNFDF